MNDAPVETEESYKMSRSSTESENIGIVVRSAIASRLILVSLIILWRSLVTPYDTSASISHDCLFPTTATSSSSKVLFPLLAAAIEHSIVWDSVYFVRIAQCGYEYEQSYAFLPLFPLCLSFFSRTVFAPLIPLIGYRAVLGLSGYVLNNAVFILAAVYLYRLSVIILKDTKTALRASILFCFNPASIFYSSIYSESLYSLLSIGGLYYLMSGASNSATFLLALSGSIRSNGVLNAGYICFHTMHQAYRAAYIKKDAYLTLRLLTSGALHSLSVFLPFISFQVYGYCNICIGRSPDETRPWCKSRVPLLYNFIQSQYWGVGFLRYFQLKQLPNFLLASPILSLALYSIVYYAKLQPKLFFSLGFQASTSEQKFLSALIAGSESTKDRLLDQKTSQICQDHKLKWRKQTIKGEDSANLTLDNGALEKPGYLSLVVLPFIFHLGFMTSTVFLIIHVQVSTRFLSASPPLYWFVSLMMERPGVGRRWGYLIWAYNVAYILFGSLLFSNFYPFT